MPRSAARLVGSVSALQRAFSHGEVGEALETAAALARAAAQSAPVEGRALFAANSELPWPAEATATLWHACTLLREHRGDGHVAALTAAGISGREANVIQAAADVVSRDIFRVARKYDDPEWDAVSEDLVVRGLLNREGKLSREGIRIRDEVEERTDRLALSAYGALDDEQFTRLLDALDELARAVIATGDIPNVTPIGERFQL